MAYADQQDRTGIGAQVSRMVDGFSRLVVQHIALARMELAEDVKAMGIQVGTIAALAPFVLVGYTLLCGALAVAISRWVGLAGGLAIVGGINVGGGLFGIFRAVGRLRSRQVLDDTIRELGRSKSLLSAESAPPPAPPPRSIRSADGR
jgi:uncharacterized membrane protein YqjE